MKEYICKIDQENRGMRDRIEQLEREWREAISRAIKAEEKVQYLEEMFNNSKKENSRLIIRANKKINETEKKFEEENTSLKIEVNELQNKIEEIRKHLYNSSFTGFNALDFVGRFFPEVCSKTEPSTIKIGDEVVMTRRNPNELGNYGPEIGSTGVVKSDEGSKNTGYRYLVIWDNFGSWWVDDKHIRRAEK